MFLRKAALAVAVSLASTAQATGIPTIDVVNVIQTTFTAFESIEQTVTMIEQYEQQIQQYQQQIESYDQQIKQLDSMTGSRGMGELLGGAQKAQDRRWVPSDWREAVSTVRAGGVPGTNQSYKVAIEQIQGGSQNSNQLGMQQNGYMAGHANSYDRAMATDAVGGAVANVAFGKSGERSDSIDALIQRIDEAEDQKAALDLNNALTAQMLILQNESIQLQATVIQMIRSQGDGQLEAQRLEANFNKWD